MADVQFKRITKKYGTTAVVSDFSLDISDGEFMVLVGPSGCGKSTILRMVAGLESITSGEVVIAGKVMNDVQPKDRNVAMVFQNYALYPHMNVYDNLSFSLKLRKMSSEAIDRQVKSTAEILNIDDLLKRKPRELSGGQSQRVALGRAIVRDPDVFLFDEPLSNLDAKLRTQMRIEIKRLHERLKSTVIYVTHDQTEAMTMGDRITVMEQGHLHQTGTSHEVYKKPKNIFVAGFIGSPSMNFFKAKKELTADGLTISTAEFSFQVIDDDSDRIQKASSPNGYVGIRAESFFLDSDLPKHTPADIIKIPASIEVSENLGSEQYLYCITPEKGEQFIARISPNIRVIPGDIVQLSFNKDHLYYFTEEGDTLLVPRN